jgi:hypothetical protein
MSDELLLAILEAFAPQQLINSTQFPFMYLHTLDIFKSPVIQIKILSEHSYLLDVFRQCVLA